MSSICSLFPLFGDPWPSCLLPSQPQCRQSLYVWHVPLTETPLYWHLCHWHLSPGQWRTDLHCCVSALTRLLWSHPALSEEPEAGREVENPPDLWFPHHCGCLLLCSLYFHICKTLYHLLYWQITKCGLYNHNPYAESINLQSKRFWDDKWYEEALQKKR